MPNNRSRRLIVCCDEGTWDGDQPGQPTTNVSGIRDVILKTSDPLLSADDFEQITHYIPGIGSTDKSALSRDFDGLTGNGLVDRLHNAYSFFAQNWRENDEIYLFGFSRGSYEARIVCSLIGKYGLLTVNGLSNFPNLLKEHQKNIDDPSTVGKGWDWLSREVPIKCIGVWDTVGAMGIPEAYFFGTPLKIPFLNKWIRGIDRKYEFTDPYINKRVEFAFHALALDERRAAFSPTLWDKKPDNNKTVLKQVWFPGCHGSIGGGDDAHGLSDVPFVWMIHEIRKHTQLKFNLDAVRNRVRETKSPWACERFRDTYIGVYRFAGSQPRKPGEYTFNGKKLQFSHERFHKSIQARADGWRDASPSYRPYATKNGYALKEANLGDLEEEMRWLLD